MVLLCAIRLLYNHESVPANYHKGSVCNVPESAMEMPPHVIVPANQISFQKHVIFISAYEQACQCLQLLQANLVVHSYKVNIVAHQSMQQWLPVSL